MGVVSLAAGALRDIQKTAARETRVGATCVNCSWYTSMASQNPYPIIVYCVNNYRPHLSYLRPHSRNSYENVTLLYSQFSRKNATLSSSVSPLPYY